MKRLENTTGIKMINVYVDVNHCIINGDYKEALILVDKLAADSCAERKAIIYHRLGDNEKAYEYMVLYKHISDSIARETHNGMVASLYLRMNNDRLRLEQELLTNQNSRLRYQFYFIVGIFIILILLVVIYQRRKIIMLLKHDNSMLHYGKTGAERALKEINELSFYESRSELPLTTPVKINKLCNHLANLTQEHCNKGVITVFQTDFDDDIEIMTNVDALEKLLIHLQDSSAQFTKEGTIKLRCADAGEMVRLSVTDSNHDFSVDAGDALEEEAETARYVGMNFNICQSIARLLRGNIWRDTTYTMGTRFFFDVPKNPSPSLRISDSK
jgi:signal transduction histidine kinase